MRITNGYLPLRAKGENQADLMHIALTKYVNYLYFSIFSYYIPFFQSFREIGVNMHKQGLISVPTDISKYQKDHDNFSLGDIKKTNNFVQEKDSASKTTVPNKQQSTKKNHNLGCPNTTLPRPSPHH